MSKIIRIFFMLVIILILSGCNLFVDSEPNEIILDVAAYTFVDEKILLESSTDGVVFEIVGENNINARIVDGKLVADKPGTIQVIAKSEDISSEPRIVYVMNKDETVTEVVLSTDLLKLDLGKVYSFGLDQLPKDAYNVESSNVDILKVLDNNNIEIVGSGRGTLKITNNLNNQVIYDDMFVVYNSILLTEIKSQLINKNVITSMNSELTQTHFDMITELDLSMKLSNDNSVSTGIKYLNELVRLDLSHNKLEDIFFIQTLTNLEHIDLSHNAITDLSALNQLSKLESINLSNNNIQNISTLRRHEFVDELNLSHNNIMDLSPISTLYDLQSLYIGNNPIDSIDHISALIKLKKLDVSYSEMIAEDVFGLDYFKNLEYIDLSGIHLSLSNIPKSLPFLEVFKINDVNLSGSDLAHLLNYDQLKVLEISKNDLDLIAVETFIRQINELNAFRYLEELSLGYNNMVSLPDFSVLPELKKLNLTGSKNLMDLSNLSLVKTLEHLDLSYCQSIENNENLIEMFTQLEALKTLSVVDGMNYFDRQLFDYFTDRIENDDEFSIEIFKDEWMNKNSVTNYAKIVYFSLAELKEHLVNVGTSYQYQYQSNQRNIILNLINDSDLEKINIIIPKDIFEVNIYSAKLKTHHISFEVEERRQSILKFNFFNFNTAAEEGFNGIKMNGEAELIIQYSGVNGMVGGKDKEAILGYLVKIDAYTDNDIFTITGGAGSNGQEGPTNNDSKSSRRGENGNNGQHGISAEEVTLNGNITITGGSGGNGGKGGNRKNWAAFIGNSGDGGNGGHGGKGGHAIYANVTSVAPTVTLNGGSGGSGGDGGKSGGLGYGDGSPGNRGDAGSKIVTRDN